MKIFSDRKASKLFYEISQNLGVRDKSRFSKGVKDLYDKKLVSQAGEFEEYLITVDDLIALGGSIKVKILKK